MRHVTGLILAGISALSGQLILSQSLPEETTDVRIRRWAGLPATSAVGQIRITDVGHHPSDTMISIVANRIENRWSVSYVCAASLYCTVDIASDHDARSYTLSRLESEQVDGILKKLSAGTEPGGVEPKPTFIGGYAQVSINYLGFKRDYPRGSSYGDLLGRLRSILSRANR
jgi:hypothetical protein